MKSVALVAPIALLILFLPAFAQNATENNTQHLETADQPVLQQRSEKGIYLVELRWPEPVIAEGGMQIEIVFLNASSPSPNLENFPIQETNNTGQNTVGGSGFTDPGIIDTTLLVESYDMAVYDGDGKELWAKQDQPGLGGRGTQNVEINYTGPVTINITDIRPGWDTGETATAEDMTDSVSFQTSVVPEFPIVAALLVAGVAGAIAVSRFWRPR